MSLTFKILCYSALVEASGLKTSYLAPTLATWVVGSLGAILIPVKDKLNSPIEMVRGEGV
jgi:hypothetical protein